MKFNIRQTKPESDTAHEHFRLTRTHQASIFAKNRFCDLMQQAKGHKHFSNYFRVSTKPMTMLSES